MRKPVNPNIKAMYTQACARDEAALVFLHSSAYSITEWRQL